MTDLDALPDFTAVTAESVAAAVEAGLAEADQLIARAVASADAPSFDGTLWPVELAGAAVANAYGRSAFMGYAHPDEAVREAGNAAEERINKWRAALPFRHDLATAVTAFAATPEAQDLDPERAQLLRLWLIDFEKAGHGLDRAASIELGKIRERLVELEVAFSRNLNEYEDGIDLTPEELDGLTPDFIARLRDGTTPGTKRVTLDYPDYYPFIAQARRRDLREAMFRKHWTRPVEANRPLITEAVRLRHRAAQILGQPTWAHVVTKTKMAATPEAIAEFYDSLASRILPARDRELAVLRERFAADGYTDEFAFWDWPYYDEQLRRTDYGVDANAVADYLPIDACLAGLFELTAEVFGVAYRQVPDAESRAWHPDAHLYELSDAASGEVLAHFYLDLFPREGKYGHAAAFPIVVGHRRADGSYARPVSAVLANFTPPSGDRPSLLQHTELETFFHEFGHILHMSLTKANFQRQSGAELEIDFVEAPSQIMEHWTWEASVIGRFARHYRTGEPLPADLLEKMLAARMVNVAIKNTVQLHYGMTDQAIHGADPEPDLEEVQRRSFTGSIGLPYPEGTFLLSSWGHPMGDYDAAYYGYLWAEVIGDDLFGRFTAEGVTSPAVGMAYREAILEPNGTRPAADLVRDFLGRDPTPDAFLRLRGLE